MALSGNKGEWSEIYALFKLLGEGKVHAGDAQMNKLNLYYPIISIIREEAKRYEYKPDVSQNIVVVDEEGVEYARISMDKFLQESATLLSEIKMAKKSAFEIPATETFMGTIGCTKLKAPSQNKADIHIIIHDLRTTSSHLLGFSIKSQLGSASTLLNAGMPTNFRYKVCGAALTDGQIQEINTVSSHLERMQEIYKAGCQLEYDDMEHETFKNNLVFLDCMMPQLVADCLLVDSLYPVASVKEVVNVVAKRNPMNFSGNNKELFYEHKMKMLLLDAALGMTPAKEWNGRYDANGGYIVVRKDGEIVCYHFYNRNDVEDYLYLNTRFEHASRSRYQYGSLYRAEDGQVYIRLNLQIRFKQ